MNDHKGCDITFITGCLCAIGCAILYGLSFVFTKHVIGSVTTLSLLGWRLFAALAVIITAGAFAGKLTANPKDCKYFEIVNEIVDETTGMISYLPPAHGKETVTGVSALDESAETYNAFVGESSGWTEAEAYDDTLEKYYTVGESLKYNLKSIPRLDADFGNTDGDGNTPADFVATHYGDWPAPEIFVLNEK